jgi:hypothetical protein
MRGSPSAPLLLLLLLPSAVLAVACGVRDDRGVSGSDTALTSDAGSGSEVQDAIDRALTGSPALFVADDGAKAIVAALDAHPDAASIARLTDFYTHAPLGWPGIEPWVGTTPRPFPLLAADADDRLERALEAHGAKGSDVMLAKFVAMPPDALPVPPTTTTTTVEWTSITWNGASFPSRGKLDPSYQLSGTYYADASAAAITVSATHPCCVSFEFTGPKIEVGQTYQGFVNADRSHEYSANISAGGWASSSGRSRFRVHELVADDRGIVKRVVVSWIVSTSLEYGVEPGYLVYQQQ